MYAPFVRYQVNLAEEYTTKMIFTEVFDLEPDVTALGNRDLWVPSSHLDSQAIEVTMDYHGGAIKLHKYDELVSYWNRDEEGAMQSLCRGKLGQLMVDHLDILARNAFGNGYFMMFSGTATGSDDSGFANLAATDTFVAEDVMKVWLQASMNLVPIYTPQGPQQTLLAITTPGVIYDIQNVAASSSHWKAVQQYQNVPPVSAYEVGQYKQVRFLQTTRNILWNSGVVSAQTTLAANVAAGDGAPTPATKVRGVYGVGQTAATHYVSFTSASDFAVGDIVSFHKQRESDNRAKWDDPVKFERQIHSIATNNVTFTKPILRDLTASETWYITKGRHVHMTVFLAGPNGVCAGVGQRPQVYSPPVVDDLMAMHRFSWDAYIKYQLFRPEFVYLIFSAGTTSWG